MEPANATESLADLEALSYEDALGRLETLVSQLERGEQSLESAMRQFESGIALSRVCARKLAVAEAKIQKLVDGDGSDLRVEPLESAAPLE